MSTRPRVGISRCLLGEEVRYDGSHKYAAEVIDALAPHVEWVPVCPEVEVGMGVPREPIELVAGPDRVRLIGVNTGADWSGRMEEWARGRIAELARLALAGFVLKSRSPSCGIRDVPVRGKGAGRGMFADALLRAMPDLVVEDEQHLGDPATREAFLEAVRKRTSGTEPQEPNLRNRTLGTGPQEPEEPKEPQEPSGSAWHRSHQ